MERPGICVDCLSVREIKRNRIYDSNGDRSRWSGTNEPGRFRQDRAIKGAILS